jgi:hypothetical protein
VVLLWGAPRSGPSRAQKAVLALGLALIAVVGAAPPWLKPKSGVLSSLLWSPPPGLSTEPNWALLSLYWSTTAILTGGLVVLLSGAARTAPSRVQKAVLALGLSVFSALGVAPPWMYSRKPPLSAPIWMPLPDKVTEPNWALLALLWVMVGVLTLGLAALLSR